MNLPRSSLPRLFAAAVTTLAVAWLVVGWYQTSSDPYEQGFVYSNGSYILLNFPGAIKTVLLSINDKGQVTGYYQTSSDHAFVYSNGQYTSIDPPESIGSFGFSINNAGQIVGYYEDNSTNHGFLATVPKK